ncbi:MAG: glycosyltransferase [Ignavibacteria bacterium]|nr:glycosyltransferase [Ignavibacteria bacterium]
MPTIDIITNSILFAYLLMHFIMLIGLLINSRKAKRSIFEPKVSVIVCAKDEEFSIEACIKSLLSLNYPAEKLEAILVNDRSVDKTADIMQSYSSKYSQLKYLEIKEQLENMKGKTNALAQAIKTATGEVIFTTDADIEVNKNWVRRMLDYYKSDTGVAAGYSVIKPGKLFYSLQSADWLYLLSVAAGGDGVGIPISCVGNNMSFIKKAYDEIGGYEKIKFSITEDFMLLQKIHKESSFKHTIFPIDDETKNITLPCTNLTQLFRQKKRWAMGGLGEFNLGIVVGILSWLTGAVILSGWAYMQINNWLFFILVKFIFDCVFLFPSIKEFRMYKIYLYLPFYEIYFAVYVIITSVLIAINRKVIWKDQKI